MRLARLYGRSLTSLLQEASPEDEPLADLFRLNEPFAASPELRKRLVGFSNLVQEARALER